MSQCRGPNRTRIAEPDAELERQNNRSIYQPMPTPEADGFLDDALEADEHRLGAARRGSTDSSSSLLLRPRRSSGRRPQELKPESTERSHIPELEFDGLRSLWQAKSPQSSGSSRAKKQRAESSCVSEREMRETYTSPGEVPLREKRKKEGDEVPPI